MFTGFLALLPPDSVKIALVLALSLLLGFEREEQKSEGGVYRFGGVRTFPLLGLTGYGLALLGGTNPLLSATGLVVVGGLMFLSYRHKLASAAPAGVTTEISGLTIYVVGALICQGYIWVSCALVILSLLLLELKSALEALTRRVPAAEISTLAKFLLLAVVILPIVPDQGFTEFNLNPFKLLVVVVAVCGVSYASYVLERLDRGRSGIFLSALLGGAYSSTVTTVVLAKRCHEDQRPALYAGSILASSGVMYVRTLILIAFFNLSLAGAVAVPFIALTVLGVGAGWWWSTRERAAPTGAREPVLARNPLQLEAALVFAIVLAVVLVLTQLVGMRLGRSGTYALGALVGLSDITPFVLGLTQTAGKVTPLGVAAASVVIAAASNNVVKGFYALAFAKDRAGRVVLGALLIFAIVGLIPLLFI